MIEIRELKKNKGFTLIELLAVILILGIIALIGIPTVNNIVEESKINAFKTSAGTYINVINNYFIESEITTGNGALSNHKYRVSDFVELDVKGHVPKNGKIYTNIDGEIYKATFCFDKYSFDYLMDKVELSTNDYCNPIILEENATIDSSTIYNLVSNDYIVEALSNGTTYSLKMSNDMEIPIEAYVFNDAMTYAETPILCNDEVDGKMCILIYNSDLTINEGVTITPQVRKKGFTIYVTGKLINNGVISMTARGAKGAGTDIILFKNNDGTVESIPAVGGAGAAKVTRGEDGCIAGKPGGSASTLLTNSGVKRATGGGGSGAACRYNSKYALSGAGSAGTSYSGGTGGGGSDTRSTNNLTGGTGSSNGGAGGAGKSSTNNGSTYSSGGGAGNPGGSGMLNNDVSSSYYGSTGTGGLLNIYVNDLINNGEISSKGSNGGAGGAGSVTIGSIATGTFVSN